MIARDGPLDEAAAAVVGLGLLDVLVAAHARGIVHRDVKPSNIFVADDGAVKLTDFGIASVEGEMRLTRTGATMGSPQFIAPEQALGHDAAPAADLWGLGASLYLAVEGVPPFERNNAVATVHAVVHESARAFERADALAPRHRPAAREGAVGPSGASPSSEPGLARVAGVDAPHLSRRPRAHRWRRSTHARRSPLRRPATIVPPRRRTSRTSRARRRPVALRPPDPGVTGREPVRSRTAQLGAGCGCVRWPCRRAVALLRRGGRRRRRR